MTKDTSKPAFPSMPSVIYDESGKATTFPGMTLRQWYAGIMQEDDRLVKCIRAMDDTVLLLFATSPGIEREEWITQTKQLCGENVFAGKAEVEKIIRRLRMEAAAIARVRFMQADAMLAASEQEQKP